MSLVALKFNGLGGMIDGMIEGIMFSQIHQVLQSLKITNNGVAAEIIFLYVQWKLEEL